MGAKIMQRLCTGYLIDPETKTIQSIKYKAGDGFNKWLPGGICVGWTYRNGDVLYVDDEGLLRPATTGFRIRSRLDGQPMMSKGILVGREVDLMDNYTVLPPNRTVEQLAEDIQFLDKEEALDWFRGMANKVAVSIVSNESSGRQILARWGDILRNLEGEPEGYHPGRSMIGL